MGENLIIQVWILSTDVMHYCVQPDLFYLCSSYITPLIINGNSTDDEKEIFMYN